ncbi:hypothetical protein HLH36_06950 [Gluconacetobacter aggeris]|uniref:Uncharacterized protein n=1 Tax=Gluconacetobacter aggeris TaxID=1286186 RepID=A0A7W4ISD8_9PROT|nr:hypothetical protein [Gluconacetobacter aggeris]MBB2168093.1 hypothetical protein [Gluconacetobacter aggeris]
MIVWAATRVTREEILDLDRAPWRRADRLEAAARRLDGTALRHPGALIGRLRHDYGWDGGTDDPLRVSWQLGPLFREGVEISSARGARQAEAPDTP